MPSTLLRVICSEVVVGSSQLKRLAAVQRILGVAYDEKTASVLPNNLACELRWYLSTTNTSVYGYQIICQ
jgi:hypothetical protein